MTLLQQVEKDQAAIASMDAQDVLIEHAIQSKLPCICNQPIVDKDTATVFYPSTPRTTVAPRSVTARVIHKDCQWAMVLRCVKARKH